ncbi:long-chain fatty acid transport protein 2-like [Diadema antillarum]|uniref:long-chain fatty acid transport protein 2-like n=1 Tax=Diadema antillarum TaxID=105358 RepID=UPI003A899B50
MGHWEVLGASALVLSLIVAGIKRKSIATFIKDFKDLSGLAKALLTYRINASRNRTVLVALHDGVVEHPSRTCILYQDERYTYAEVEAESNRVSRWVKTHTDLQHGDTAAILLRNEPMFVFLWLGFAKLGISTSLLNHNLKSQSLLHCIKISNVKVLITSKAFLDVIAELLPDLQQLQVKVWVLGDTPNGHVLPDRVSTMDTSQVSGNPLPPDQLPKVTPQDISSLIFTSGTTGLPKAVQVPHRTSMMAYQVWNIIGGLWPDDVLYVCLPLYHSSGLINGVLSAINAGCTIALAPKFSASRFWDDVHKHKATVFLYIGELCRYLLAQPEKANDGQYDHTLRMAYGNGLGSDIWEEFRRRFNIQRIVEWYTATEASGGFINTDGKVGSVGRYSWLAEKLAGNCVIVECDFATAQPVRGADGRCIPVPRGEVGLLLFKQDKLNKFLGYRGAAKQTENKLVRNVRKPGDLYFNSGDLMMFGVDGYVYFKDRLGDTFRWKGENVSTTEVSNAMSRLPAVMECNVYGVEVPGCEGRAGMAAIVLQDGEVFDPKQLYDHAINHLPDYACPKFIRIMSEMDITTTFKHKKRALVSQGFNPGEIADLLYVADKAKATYAAMDANLLDTIGRGAYKL